MKKISQKFIFKLSDFHDKMVFFHVFLMILFFPFLMGFSILFFSTQFMATIINDANLGNFGNLENIGNLVEEEGDTLIHPFSCPTLACHLDKHLLSQNFPSNLVSGAHPSSTKCPTNSINLAIINDANLGNIGNIGFQFQNSNYEVGRSPNLGPQILNYNQMWIQRPTSNQDNH